MDAVPGLERMIAYTIRQPLGIVVGIVPFNYPAELFAHNIPGALAAGNSVIVKLPEQCPLTVLKLGEILLNAGLPPEGMQMLTGYPADLGDALLTHPESRWSASPAVLMRLAKSPQKPRELSSETRLSWAEPTR